MSPTVEEILLDLPVLDNASILEPMSDHGLPEPRGFKHRPLHIDADYLICKVSGAENFLLIQKLREARMLSGEQVINFLSNAYQTNSDKTTVRNGLLILAYGEFTHWEFNSTAHNAIAGLSHGKIEFNEPITTTDRLDRAIAMTRFVIDAYLHPYIEVRSSSSMLSDVYRHGNGSKPPPLAVAYLSHLKLRRIVYAHPSCTKEILWWLEERGWNVLFDYMDKPEQVKYDELDTLESLLNEKVTLSLSGGWL